MSDLQQTQQVNLATVQQLYTAFASHDIAAITPLLSPEVDWLFFGPAEIPFAGHYIGPPRVATFFTRALETAEFQVFTPREFIAGTNSILVQGHERGIAKSTGKGWETEWAHVFTLEGGRITKLREYYDTAVMVAAFRE